MRGLKGRAAIAAFNIASFFVTLALALALAAGGLGCRAKPFDLVRFDASAAPPPAPRAEEPHQVHFTYSAPDAVTFNWMGHGTTLRFWTKGTPPRTVEARAPSPAAPFSSPGPWQEAVADGLVPGAEYHYQVGTPLRPVPLSFRAPPAPGTAGFRFVAAGDFGATSDGSVVGVVHRMIRIADPVFVLALGDLTYADLSTQASVDRHFEDAMVWSRRAAYMPVWGNHEWDAKKGSDDLRNYKGRFALPHASASPGAPAAGCCGEDWYWFDHGNTRFISYPEPYTAETWPDWARRTEPLFAEAEAAPMITFVVTFGHRPAYSSGRHPGEPALRAILDGFGARFGKYVLNVAGHSHGYERTTPQAHVVHLTAGIGGGMLDRAETPCLWPECKAPPSVAFRALRHGIVKVIVQPAAITVEAICGPPSPGRNDIRCADGEIFDRAVISAPAPARAATASARSKTTAARRQAAAAATPAAEDASLPR